MLIIHLMVESYLGILIIIYEGENNRGGWKVKPTFFKISLASYQVYHRYYKEQEQAMDKKFSSAVRGLKRTFSSQVTRAEARQHCGHLEKFIERTLAFNGIEKYQYLAIYSVTSLGGLITDTRHDNFLKEHGLWMYKVREPGEQGYFGTCDLEIIQQLREKRKAPFISHICREPSVEQLPEKSRLTDNYDFDGSTLEACLLVTVYSLIQQLLQLKLSLDEEQTKIDINMLTSLEMRMSHWNRAMEMLGRLLRKTPSLEFCVLYWLPALDEGNAREKSEALISLLYKYKESNGLRLIFVTWGESRLLKEKVDRQKLHQVEIKMDTIKYPEIPNWRNEVVDRWTPRGNVR